MAREVIAIRLDAGERTAIEGAAAGCGVTTVAYIREAALQAAAKSQRNRDRNRKEKTA